MANNSWSTNPGGIGFVGLLTIVFIVLKLTGLTHWSWWWVLAPLWITAAVVGMVLVAIVAIAYGYYYLGR